jgi:hypothetical protein
MLNLTVGSDGDHAGSDSDHEFLWQQHTPPLGQEREPRRASAGHPTWHWFFVQHEISFPNLEPDLRRNLSRVAFLWLLALRI